MEKKKNISLAVCVPLSWWSVPSAFFVSYTSLFVPSRLEAMARAGVKKLWHIVDPAFPLDFCRNRLVKKALELGATRVLFLDADMTFPQDLIVNMLKVDADVAGALYFKKLPPFQPVPGNFDVENDEQLMRPIRLPVKPGIVECDVLGMGATIISQEVLIKIQHPWFSYERYKKTGETEVTEDVTFCKKVKKTGFKIACDTSIVCGHIRPEIVGASHWEACRTIYEDKYLHKELRNE